MKIANNGVTRNATSWAVDCVPGPLPVNFLEGASRSVCFNFCRRAATSMAEDQKPIKTDEAGNGGNADHINLKVKGQVS